MKKIILIGGGGHAKSVIDVIEQENKYQIFGIFDKKERIGEKVLNYEIIGTDEDINKYLKDFYFLITIGQIQSAELRKNLFEKIKKENGNFATIISPLAYLAKNTQIGEGTVIMHHALINTSAKIGTNCIINSKALIEHDAQIGNNCHISTGTIINGGAEIKDNTFIGSGAIVVNCAKIEANGFIKAGSLCK